MLRCGRQWVLVDTEAAGSALRGGRGELDHLTLLLERLRRLALLVAIVDVGRDDRTGDQRDRDEDRRAREDEVLPAFRGPLLTTQLLEPLPAVAVGLPSVVLAGRALGHRRSPSSFVKGTRSSLGRAAHSSGERAYGRDHVAAAATGVAGPRPRPAAAWRR